MVYQNLWQIN